MTWPLLDPYPLWYTRGHQGQNGLKNRRYEVLAVVQNSRLMALKKETKDVELKVKIPKDLMTRIKDFWHEQKLDCRKEAVVTLLERGLLKDKEPKQGETT